VSDNNVESMTFIDGQQIVEWQEHLCPTNGGGGETKSGKKIRGGVEFSSEDEEEDEDVLAKRRNKTLAALLGKKLKPLRRNAYSMVIPPKLLRVIENIPRTQPPGAIKPLKWILRYISSILNEKIAMDTIDDRYSPTSTWLFFKRYRRMGIVILIVIQINVDPLSLYFIIFFQGGQPAPGAEGVCL
jgi:hypothetical protein